MSPTLPEAVGTLLAPEVRRRARARSQKLSARGVFVARAVTEGVSICELWELEARESARFGSSTPVEKVVDALLPASGTCGTNWFPPGAVQHDEGVSGEHVVGEATPLWLVKEQCPCPPPDR